MGGVAGACPGPHTSLVLAQVWRIENLELVPVESKWLGHFYGGDCYLLLYTYLIGEKPHYLLYIWQVRPCSPCPELSQLSSYPTIPLPSGHPLCVEYSW